MVCRRCQEFGDGGFTLEKLKIYIKSIEDGIRCDEDVYEARLLKCNDCKSLVNGMCRYCGCFVLLRAAKKPLDCPDPSGSRWVWDRERTCR